jgi:hypothetical protein
VLGVIRRPRGHAAPWSPRLCLETVRIHRVLQLENSCSVWRSMAWYRSRVLDWTWECVGRGECSSRFQVGGRPCWSRSERVDAAGAAARFASLLSSNGMPIEDISYLVEHASTKVAEVVYRKELRPMRSRGAIAMDGLFPEAELEG